MRNPWLRLGFDTWSLGLDASAVIALRTLKIAGGGADVAREMTLMVQEKLDSAAVLQTRMMSGALGANPGEAAQRTLTHYRRKVAANRRRLCKA